MFIKKFGYVVLLFEVQTKFVTCNSIVHLFWKWYNSNITSLELSPWRYWINYSIQEKILITIIKGDKINIYNVMLRFFHFLKQLIHWIVLFLKQYSIEYRNSVPVLRFILVTIVLSNQANIFYPFFCISSHRLKLK